MTARTLLLVAAVVALIAMPGLARAGHVSIVYPPGVFPTDVQNVQAAADLGGTVLLKATSAAGEPTAFNFGTFASTDPARFQGRLLLRTDVDITGEQAGTAVSTIRGGFGPIQTGFAGNQPVSVRASVRDLTFDRPLSTAIAIRATTGFQISGNRITGVVPFRGFAGFQEVDGIVFALPLVAGKVRITDNVIENLHADFANGIAVTSVIAEFEIGGNTIRDITSQGILVSAGSASSWSAAATARTTSSTTR